ncbi:hypothetical protein [Halochromatium glycolicum]|jgi:hypothetical protein|uniref:DUF2281 domain-containing protein n=1 Tax=Halochromatium glycolicum TaxID=85075 RepID=A0AAJ0XAI4_9GAMM|nr:hypothetical protein [Halochromatium glycolicum]MBK1705844.1 hypothetical protein [Halochromatium glycolicum]
MQHLDLIVREAADLADAQRAEVLDFIGYLKTRHPVERNPDAEQRLAELTAFFAPYRKDLSGFMFDRDEANAR